MRSILSTTSMILLASKFLYALPEMSESVLNQPIGKPKSVGRGYCWSLGCTVLPIVIPLGIDYAIHRTPTLAGSSFTVIGVLAGPCGGHFYAGQWRRSLVSIGVRLGSVAIAAVGFNASWSEESDFYNLLMVAGVIGFLGSIGYDFVTIPRSVRKYNIDHGFQMKSEINLEHDRYSFGLAWGFN